MYKCFFQQFLASAVVSRLSPEHYICIHKGYNYYNVDYSDCFVQEYMHLYAQFDNADPVTSKSVIIFNLLVRIVEG